MGQTHRAAAREERAVPLLTTGSDARLPRAPIAPKPGPEEAGQAGSDLNGAVGWEATGWSGGNASCGAGVREAAAGLKGDKRRGAGGRETIFTGLEPGKRWGWSEGNGLSGAGGK